MDGLPALPALPSSTPDLITVVARPNPLEEPVLCYVEPGISLQDIVGGQNPQLHVTWNSAPVPSDDWAESYPKAGDYVTVVVAPGTFGILESIIASISSTVAASATAGATAGLTAAGVVGITGTVGSTIAAVTGSVLGVASMLGSIASMAMSIYSAIVRPQTPSVNGATGARNRLYGLTQGNNAEDPWGYIPKLYGQCRFTPPLGGQYYTHTEDGEQYLHVLLCLGYGPMVIGKIEDINGAPSQECTPAVGQSTWVGQTFMNVAPLLTSRDPNYNWVVNKYVMIGDAELTDLNTHWRRQSAPIKWQIGTIDAIMNPGKYIEGEDPIYTSDVEEEQLNKERKTGADLYYSDDDNKWVNDPVGGLEVQVSPTNTVRIDMDLSFNALYHMAGETQVNRGGMHVLFQVEYQRSDMEGWWPAPLQKNITGAWDTHDGTVPNPGVSNELKPSVWYISGNTLSPFRRTNSFYPCWWENNVLVDPHGAVPAGTKYNTRLIRFKTLKIKHVVNTVSDAVWSRIAYTRNSPAWIPSPYHNTENVILMAMLIKANSRVNDNLDPITVLATSVLPYATEGTQGYGPTNNPADIYADVLRGTQLHPGVRLPHNLFDWYKLHQWRNFCEGEPTGRLWSYNYYHTDNEPILDRLRAVATTGRAAWALVNGNISVIRDNEFTPVQMITPRNSRSFEFTKAYPKVPHALRVRWVNPTSWQQDELLVLDDGYMQQIDGRWYDYLGRDITANPNLAHPTLFEVLETQGVTTRQQAFREGRYFLAAMRMRRETYKVEVDIENIVATRGDCVQLTHDALLLARTAGRIKSVSGQQITLDEPVSFDVPAPAEGFCLQVRHLDGNVTSGVNVRYIQLVHPGTDAPQYTVTAAVTGYADGRLPGDLFLFGRHTYEKVDAKITQIDYQPDLSATLTLVPAAPDIQNADIQDINDDFPGIVPDPPPEMRAPYPPFFDSLTASPHDVYLGPGNKILCKVVANWTLQQQGARADYVYVNYRWGNDGESDWVSVRQMATLGTLSISGVPANTLVTAFLQGQNEGTGRFSEPSRVIQILTPDADFFLPLAPSALRLEQESFELGGDPQPTYWIRAQWRVNGFSADIQLYYTTLENAQAYPDPLNETSPWQGPGSLGAGAVNYVIGADVEEGDERILGETSYTVAVRNKVLDKPNDGISPYSNWAKADISVYLHDVAPGAPSNLTATGKKDRITLDWDNPVNEDLARVQIWVNRYNSRNGEVAGYPVPAATLLADLSINQDGQPNTYDHFVTDHGAYYYWARAIDAAGLSSAWHPANSNDGVRGTLGIPGDGAPPKPCTELTLTTDNWQVLLEWKRPEIVDFLKTEVYWKAEDAALAEVPAEPPTGSVAIGATVNRVFTHTGFSTDDIGIKFYYYWIRNADVEGLYSEYISAGVELVWDGSNYLKLFRVKQLTADTIDSRGLTIKNAAGDLVLGSGTTSLPTWVQGNNQWPAWQATLNLFGSENFLKGAAIEGLIALLPRNGQASLPSAIRSIDYLPANGTVPGRGWNITGDGDAEFNNLVARGTLYSDDYSPYGKGWKVHKDGDVEFNSGTFRGELGADTLLLGTGYRLGSLGEDQWITAVNIRGPEALWFVYDAQGNCISNNVLQFSIVNAGTTTWTLNGYTGTTPTVIRQTTGTSFTVAAAEFGSYDLLQVVANVSGVWDAVAIHKITPSTGVKLVLSNDLFWVGTDRTGVPISYKYGAGLATLWNGIEKVPTGDRTLSIDNSNCTVTIDQNGQYELTNLVDNTALSTITATYNGSQYTAVFYPRKQVAIRVGGMGDHSARWFLSSGNYNNNSWSDVAGLMGVVGTLSQSEGGPYACYVKDVLTLKSTSTSYSQTRWLVDNGGVLSWAPLSAYIHGDMLVNGSIFAKHIQADSIYANHIVANQINANHIQAGAITADKINVNTLHADKIISGSIAATSIASSAASSSGTGFHDLYANQVTVPAEHAGRGCIVIANVSVETSVNTNYVEFRVDGLTSPRVLYDKTAGGSLDSRFFSVADAWYQVLPAAGAYNVYVKVKHKDPGGTSSDPRIVFTFQRA